MLAMVRYRKMTFFLQQPRFVGFCDRNAVELLEMGASVYCGCLVMPKKTASKEAVFSF
jgi:hypothetical protein